MSLSKPYWAGGRSNLGASGGHNSTPAYLQVAARQEFRGGALPLPDAEGGMVLPGGAHVHNVAELNAAVEAVHAVPPVVPGVGEIAVQAA